MDINKRKILSLSFIFKWKSDVFISNGIQM